MRFCYFIQLKNASISVKCDIMTGMNISVKCVSMNETNEKAIHWKLKIEMKNWRKQVPDLRCRLQLVHKQIILLLQLLKNIRKIDYDSRITSKTIWISFYCDKYFPTAKHRYCIFEWEWTLIGDVESSLEAYCFSKVFDLRHAPAQWIE